MGKRFVVAVSCVLILAGSAVAGGRVGGFYSLWMADDLGSSGIGGGVKLDIPLADRLCLEARGSYYNDFEDAGSESVAIPLEISAVGEFPLGETLNLYTGGGVGYYLFPEYEANLADFGLANNGTVDVDPEDVIGYHVFAGLELLLGESACIFVDAQYRSVSFDEVDFSANGMTQTIKDAEGEASGIVINAGLGLVW